MGGRGGEGVVRSCDRSIERSGNGAATDRQRIGLFSFSVPAAIRWDTDGTPKGHRRDINETPTGHRRDTDWTPTGHRRAPVCGHSSNGENISLAGPCRICVSPGPHALGDSPFHCDLILSPSDFLGKWHALQYFGQTLGWTSWSSLGYQPRTCTKKSASHPRVSASIASSSASVGGLSAQRRWW